MPIEDLIARIDLRIAYLNAHTNDLPSAYLTEFNRLKGVYAGIDDNVPADEYRDKLNEVNDGIGQIIEDVFGGLTLQQVDAGN